MLTGGGGKMYFKLQYKAVLFFIFILHFIVPQGTTANKDEVA